MNLNPLILANIQSSSYFKVSLFKLKTYHEVIDEIYYQVKHLEPWERGSRKTAGQTGMCGGVGNVYEITLTLNFSNFTTNSTYSKLIFHIKHQNVANSKIDSIQLFLLFRHRF